MRTTVARISRCRRRNAPGVDSTSICLAVSDTATLILRHRSERHKASASNRYALTLAIYPPKLKNAIAREQTEVPARSARLAVAMRAPLESHSTWSARVLGERSGHPATPPSIWCGRRVSRLPAPVFILGLRSFVAFKPRLSCKCYAERLQQQERVECKDNGRCRRGQYGRRCAALADTHNFLSATEPKQRQHRKRQR